MSGHAGQPDEEVAVYEFAGEDSSSETEIQPEVFSEEIETEPAVHNQALSVFLEPATCSNEPVKDRVARVRREIEELRQIGAETESTELIAELQAAVRPKSALNSETKDTVSEEKAPTSQTPNTSWDATESFASLESRVASLESKLGASVRSKYHNGARLTDTLNAMRRILRILSLDPAELQKRITKLKEAAMEKPIELESREINQLSKRLSSLDDDLRLLPQVATRLQTLKRYHQRSLANIDTLSDLQRQLDQMSADIKAWRELLPQLESKLENFEAVSRRNIEKLP